MQELVPEGSIDLSESERTAESYAVASFAIEKFWDYLKDRISADPRGVSERLSNGNEGADTIPKKFAFALNGALDRYRDEFIDEFLASLKQKDESTVSKSDLLLLRYFKVMEPEADGKLAIPSMQDLVTMIGRIGDVIPRVYETELKREPTDEELFASIDDPSMKRLFMEIMTNGRVAITPLLVALEGGKDVDLDDYTREFNPSFFTLKKRDDGSAHVIFRPEIAQRYREVWAVASEKRTEDKKESPRALQCPVLYTGKFVEMYDWVAQEFRTFSENAREAGSAVYID